MSSDAGMDHPSLPQIEVEMSGPYLKTVSSDMN
ncbi:mCG148249 [Mus musculus]|nr:mCG148249 [Mus musculus]